MGGSTSARQRWNARYASEPAPAVAAAFLVERGGLLPHVGSALDVAGGTGANALWLARRGLEVTLVDVADEACRIARERARQAGVPMRALRRDLEHQPLPAGPWDVIVVHHYLQRAVIPQAARRLRPGGVLLLSQPTVRNLERHHRPSRRWLLDEGELARLVAAIAGVEVLELDEGWTSHGRHEAWVVLRRWPG